MKTLLQYDTALESVKKRLSAKLEKLTKSELTRIAADLNMSAQSVFDYKDGKGNSFRTVLRIEEHLRGGEGK